MFKSAFFTENFLNIWNKNFKSNFVEPRTISSFNKSLTPDIPELYIQRLNIKIQTMAYSNKMEAIYGDEEIDLADIMMSIIPSNTYRTLEQMENDECDELFDTFEIMDADSEKLYQIALALNLKDKNFSEAITYGNICYIDHFFIHPYFRRAGLGTEIVNMLPDMILASSSENVYPVLVAIPDCYEYHYKDGTKDLSKKAKIEFCEKNGFQRVSKDVMYKPNAITFKLNM